MAISPEAFQALQALHDGARYNIMHTIARELIDAGLAHAGFGNLEITEAGRIWVRRGVTPVARSYIVDDPNIANLAARQKYAADLAQLDRVAASFEATNVNNPPVANTPAQPEPKKEPIWHPPLVLPPEAPPEPEVLPPAPMTDGALAWSRDRAVRAAGAASGSTDHWPPPGWLEAFMVAYEHA